MGETFHLEQHDRKVTLTQCDVDNDVAAFWRLCGGFMDILETLERLHVLPPAGSVLSVTGCRFSRG